MLFNSYLFIFLFLPLAISGYLLINRFQQRRVAIVWLILMSLLFFGWTNLAFLLPLTASILGNYALGTILFRGVLVHYRKAILAAGVSGNLLLLGYFKYANFFIDNLNVNFGLQIHIGNVLLPLAISFYTFVQIAYLVDAFRGKLSENSFLHYVLFVTFFPKLIAGPIMRHGEMSPQLSAPITYRFSYDNFSTGFTIFFIGLFQKVILADTVAAYAAPVFNAAAAGIKLTFLDAWTGALAYTAQIYFDFAGYSDMAIGAGRMFGINIPVNFNSPYKAVNIIDFWRRWHITLSSFLRDYLYIPLGGGRRGLPRKYVNLAVTMLLAGFWHGAGWTFIIWGGLHGLYLVINHGWQALRQKLGQEIHASTRWGNAISWLVTFTAVTFAWVFFRAESLDAAKTILVAMLGLNGLVVQPSVYAIPGAFEPFPGAAGITSGAPLFFSITGTVIIFLALAISWFAPNTQEIMADYFPSPGAARGIYPWLRWRPSFLWATISATFTVIALLALIRVSEFLYFQF